MIQVNYILIVVLILFQQAVLANPKENRLLKRFLTSEEECHDVISITKVPESICVINRQKKLQCFGKINERSGDMFAKPSKEQYDSVSCSTDYCIAIQTMDKKLKFFGLSMMREDKVPRMGKFEKVDCSHTHCCVLDKGGVSTCFGQDQYTIGQGFMEVATTFLFSCGILSDGSKEIKCWDDRDFHFDAPEGRFDSISLSRDFGCGLTETEHKLKCWAYHPFYHSSGLGKIKNLPIDVSFISIDCTQHGLCCGIQTEDRKIRCWGNEKVMEKILIDIPDPDKYDDIWCETSDDSTSCCAMSEDYRELVCWGSDNWSWDNRKEIEDLQLCIGNNF